MNAELELPSGYLLCAGDAPAHLPYGGMKGVSLTLNYDTAEEADAVFNALSDGGKVMMPFGPTSGQRNSVRLLISSALPGFSMVNPNLE